MKKGMKIFLGTYGKKQETKDTDAPKEEPKDLLMSVRYSIKTKDPYTKEGLSKLLSSVFAPFLSS
ncbi:hypothetical protein IKO18_00835 [bacterium]|jgi:hypothetical protein|nr:hypothetical protein [bacterium]